METERESQTARQRHREKEEPEKGNEEMKTNR